MAINTNYTNPSISYLNDPRFTSPAPGADDKMLKYADGLTQDKDHGGFHVDVGNWFVGDQCYDANQHGDATTRDAISNWANVLRNSASSPEDKATARRELSALIPKQLQSLKSDGNGIGSFGWAHFDEKNGFDILVNNGQIKGGDDYFQPGFDPKDLGTLNGDRQPDGIQGDQAMRALNGDMAPENLAKIALQLQVSGDSDLQALGTKLSGLVKNVQDRQAKPGVKSDDCLLNVSASAITDLMKNQIQPYQAAIQAHLNFASSSTTPGDSTTQAIAQTISQLDISKLPNGLQAQLQSDLDLYNKRNPTAAQLSLGQSTTPPAAPTPSSLQGTTVGPQTYTVNEGDNLTSIGQTAMNAAYQKAGLPAPATEEVSKYIQQMIALNLNQSMNPAGDTMVDANLIQPGWTVNLPAINLPGATSPISLPQNARYNAAKFS